jgi:hypothetical protein
MGLPLYDFQLEPELVGELGEGDGEGLSLTGGSGTPGAVVGPEGGCDPGDGEGGTGEPTGRPGGLSPTPQRFPV